MNLTEKLQSFNNKGIAQRPNDQLKIMENSTKELLTNEIGKFALKVGDKLPAFKLNNATGKSIDIYDYLNQGPLVINFYRGAWCPYCNFELQAYEEILPEIKAHGANLVAISPELPDTSLTLIDKHSLEFEILTDTDNSIAKELGIVFKLDKELLALYKSWGIDLATAQGNENGELPLPATFVVDTNGIVVLADFNIDYTKRLEPSDAVAALATL